MTDDIFFPTAEMLSATGARQTEWHERAAHLTRSQFGSRVFVRGVVEVSNFCRENCSYCGMRRENRNLERYRARHDGIAELLIHHRPESVTDINLQAGEDPKVVREVVLPLIQTLRRHTELGVSVCLGTLDRALYDELRSAGASVYIMKFELADPAQYAGMHAPGTFAERIGHIEWLAANGWHVSSGFIVGLPGQDLDQVLMNFSLAQQLPLNGCSVSPFIPGDETPLAGNPPADIDLTLNCMAGLRLMHPDWVIPAVSALNIAQPGCGYERGLSCGANLVTINLTPTNLRDNYLLYKRERFIMTEDRILAALDSLGLAASKQSLADHLKLAWCSRNKQPFVAPNLTCG